MGRVIIKLLTALGAIAGIGAACFGIQQSLEAMKTLNPEYVAMMEAPPVHEEPSAEAGHGEAKAEGGHGEAKPAEGGHGEAKPAEGGHGAAKAEAGHGEAKPAESGGHGAPAEGGHGAPAAAAMSANVEASVSLDEIYVNLGGPKEKSHDLALKLELELFKPEHKGTLGKRQGGLRHVVLDAARREPFDRLKSVPGKLYFKEKLVGDLNQFLGAPVVKNIHFISFYLQ